MAYFMITAGADGIGFQQVTKEEVHEAAQEGQTFLGPDDEIDGDPSYWESAVLIKGKIIQPKPVEKVTAFEIE